MRAAAIAALLLCAACAGDPFAYDGGPSPLTIVGGDAGAQGSALDGSADTRESAAAGDADAEVTPPTSDGAAGNDARVDAALDAPADQALDAPLDAQAEAEASAVDSAPPPALCCVGAGQASCSSAVQCYAPGASCSAENVYLPDGGQYQTFTCPGSSSPCSSGCAAGASCLWPGPEPGQWLGGTIGACR